MMGLQNLSQASQFIIAFNEVMELYGELLEINGTKSCSQINDSPHPLTSFPTIVEYIIDVEKIAKKTLDRKEYLHFLYVYKYTYEEKIEAFKNKQTFTIMFDEHKIQKKMGRAILKNNLFPFNKYLRKNNGKK